MHHIFRFSLISFTNLDFKLTSKYKPTGDQPEAIAQLVEGLNRGDKAQVLLGVTGSGKTFTVANVIASVNRPTLILSHNKTLAAQLYEEMKGFFPENAVEYYVSYYDYYQPEAYLPSTDTYIEKDLAINDEIDKLRLSAVSSLLSGRKDVVVVSSVSCIYGMGGPVAMTESIIPIHKGQRLDRNAFLRRLVDALYVRNDIELKRGEFRVKGDHVDIFMAYSDNVLRVTWWDDEIDEIEEIDALTFHHLATKLRERRMAQGSLNFHSEEVKFILDEKGKPSDTYIRVQNESHELIEDFMLLANRTVAETFGKPESKWHNHTFVYRVHDEPNPEKLNNFLRLISRVGYTMDISSRIKLVRSYNKVFEDVEGKGEKNLVETVAIRTMAKAVYSTENIGHYGLSFDYYTHVTSPIRRYPDLMVHRLIERYLFENQGSVDKKQYDEYCKHTSEMEKQAEEMERQSVKYKQAEYLQVKIVQVIDGMISGVSKWGLYVELKGNKCEGLVRYDDMPGDYYYLDEENFRVIGQQSGRVIQLGDEVQVIVKKVDLLKRQMDFELILEDKKKKKSNKKR